MSVRYTATWYDVMQARQHHTHQSSTVSYSQCCQVAEIPAKKLKRGHRKKMCDVFGNLPTFFSNWPNFLDVLAGNFFGTWQH